MTDFEWSPGDGQSDSGTGWALESVIRKNVRFFLYSKIFVTGVQKWQKIDKCVKMSENGSENNKKYP